MVRLLRALLFAAIGYAIGGLLGYVLVMALSPNQHDRDLEAAMTGAFAVGPLVALLAAIVGVVRGGRRTPPA